MSEHDPGHGPSARLVPWADPATLRGKPPLDHVLAVYGTLRPGESNFDVVAGIGGRWFTGLIRGRRFTTPAGRYRGYPAFVASASASDPGVVAVAVLVSDELPQHWARLDDFEGPGYRRVPITVSLDPAGSGGAVTCQAYVYETRPHPT